MCGSSVFIFGKGLKALDGFGKQFVTVGAPQVVIFSNFLYRRTADLTRIHRFEVYLILPGLEKSLEQVVQIIIDAHILISRLFLTAFFAVVHIDKIVIPDAVPMEYCFFSLTRLTNQGLLLHRHP